jgi:hypothetical protein
MQVRVHPRAVSTGDVLRDLVRAVPVASPFVPQRFERAMHACRRRGCLERCFELGKIHVDRIARESGYRSRFSVLCSRFVFRFW